MKQKLLERILRDGKAETNRFQYAVFSGWIWKRQKHCMAEWEKVRKVTNEGSGSV